jgi:type III secretory pathway component EscV
MSYKKPVSKAALYAVLAAGLVVVVMGFLAGAFLFGLSIAAAAVIWVGGWLYLRQRQASHNRAVRREVEAQRRADAAAAQPASADPLAAQPVAGEPAPRNPR